MWELEEFRVDEEFDKVTPEEHREIRAGESGLPVVRMYRNEFARWEQDADEPEKLGTVAVVWKLVEKPCECGSDPASKDDECVCVAGIAAAVASALRDWDVWPDSGWEASCSPVPWADEAQMVNVWVSATEQYEYEYERNTRFEYSLHVEGVTPQVRREVFAAVGVEPKAEAA